MDFEAVQSNGDGFDFTDDMNHVLGPVTAQFPAGRTGLVDGAAGFRDGEGNIAFPGRYEGGGDPSFRPEAGPKAPATGPGEGWPRKNEDGSYQIAPGARVVFEPFSPIEAELLAPTITAGIGTGLGTLLAPGAGTVAGAAAAGGMIGAAFQKPFEKVLQIAPVPRIRIEGGGHPEMSAPDYPNGNRGEF